MNVRITWDTLEARKIVCEKYYQLKHSTMLDREIKDEWCSLGVPASTCNAYIRMFRARIGAGKLTSNQAKNFLVFHYYLTSSHMSKKEIIQEWNRIGFSDAKANFWALKIDGEWRDKLKAGHVNVFEEPKRIINESRQQDVCEKICANRRTGITDDDIKRIWWLMGVSDSECDGYMEIFSKKYSSESKINEANIEVGKETMECPTSIPSDSQNVEVDSNNKNLDFPPLLPEPKPNFGVETLKLTVQQAKNFLVTYYYLIFPWMTDKDIIETWNKLGFPSSGGCKYLDLFRSGREWEKSLQDGHVSVFNLTDRIFDDPEQEDVCEFIFSHRQESITEDDIRRVWLYLGVPTSLCGEYMAKFLGKELQNSIL